MGGEGGAVADAGVAGHNGTVLEGGQRIGPASEILIPVTRLQVAIEAGPEGQGGRAMGLEDQLAGNKQVLAIAEASLGFNGVGVAIPPIGSGDELPGAGAQVELVLAVADGEFPGLAVHMELGMGGMAE